MLTTLFYFIYRLIMIGTDNVKFFRILKSLYIIVLLILIIAPVAIWCDELFEADSDDWKVKISKGYHKLFAVMMLFAAFIIFLQRNSSVQVRLTSTIILAAIYLLVFVVLQLAEAKANNIAFWATLPIFVLKEMLAVLWIIAIPFAILITLLQICWMLIAIPLHIFGVPFYWVTPKKTAIIGLLAS